MKTHGLVAAFALCIAFGAQVADACSPVPPREIQYEVGDLLTQYAIHADVIQIVRAGRGATATGRGAQILRRYEPGADPADFRLNVVRTLADTPLSRSATPLTFRAQRGDPPDQVRAMRPFVLDPRYLTRRLTLPPPSPNSEAYYSYCGIRYALAEGDVFIAMRRRDGVLYRDRHLLMMPSMDVRIVDIGGDGRARWAGVTPLLRIRGLDDPIIALLEQRIREQHAAREARARAALWRDALRLIFGRPLPDPEH